MKGFMTLILFSLGIFGAGVLTGLVIPTPENVKKAESIIEYKTDGTQNFYVVTKVFATKEEVTNFLEVYEIRFPKEGHSDLADN